MKQRLLKAWKFVTKPWKRFWSWYKGLYRKAPWWKKLCVGFLSFIAFLLLYSFAVIFNLFWLFGSSPSLSEILHPRNPEASILYSADGVEMSKYFSENRQPVPYDSIAPCFFDALVVTEDERFYSHFGIDVVGLFSAAKDATQGKARGASTITQQLVKNMFRVRTHYGTGLLGYIPGLGIVIQKSKEMIIATEIEIFASKKEILEMYANTVDFGYNSFGIKTAARTYFDTTPSQLKVEEAAILVGLLKATTYYNPKSNPKNALERRNQVLENMCEHNKLTRAECDSLKALPINLRFHMEEAYDGKALYFRQAVADEVKRLCPECDIYGDGLKIYTTIDSRMQQYAEEAVNEKMAELHKRFLADWGDSNPWTNSKREEIPGFLESKVKQTEAYRQLRQRFPDKPDSVWHYLNKPHTVHLFDYDGKKCSKHRRLGHDAYISTLDSLNYMLHFMHTGFVAMEPQTGHVKAYVGDVDFHSWPYDKVMAKHQPGSTFKLFVYSAGMENGMTPAYRLLDERIEMRTVVNGKEQVWSPRNAGSGYSYANLSLRRAFAKSVNTIAVKIGQEVGIPEVIRVAHAMGVKSPLANAPSLPLGVSDVSVLEMVNGYATVANGGEHIRPVFVTRILDRDGNEIYNSAVSRTRAISSKSAYFMQNLLEGGCKDGGGTSLALNSYLGKYSGQLDYGAKTGTTNNQCDGWFMCATPHLVAGAWVGGEYREIHFRSGVQGQGSRSALPVVGRFMEKVLDDPTLRYKYLVHYPEPNFEIDPRDLVGYYDPSAMARDTLVLDDAFLDDAFLNEEPLDVEDDLAGEPHSRVEIVDESWQ